MKLFVTGCTLLCSILFTLQAIAQQDWKMAKLVTHDSDTINGQVAFKDWDKSPAFIEFKDEGGKISRKSATEIKSFRIQESLKTFDSKSVRLSYYSKEPVKEGTSPIAESDSVTVFMEVLLQSTRITLYECMDEYNETRFFLQKDQKLHELRNPVYRLLKGDTPHLIKSEVYKSQLKQILSECPTLNTDAVTYTDKDIMKVLVTYHTYCKTDYETPFKQELPGERFAIGAFYRHVSQDDVPGNYLGGSFFLFSKKKFNSMFLLVDLGFRVGGADDDGTKAEVNRLCFGVYGGKYFGLGDIHPMIFTGISTTNGALDTGAGISVQRLLSVSASIGLIPLTKGDVAWSFQLRITPFSN